MPPYLPPEKALEKAAFAALPPDSQQLVSALVENVKTSVSALVGRKVMLADAIVLVPILGLGPAAAVMATLDGWVSTPGTSDVAYKSMVNYAVLKASALRVLGPSEQRPARG